jgi:hypothetical protein
MLLVEPYVMPTGEGLDELLDVGEELALDVRVHDWSRLEWKVVLSTSRMDRYRLVFELDVPANLFPPHVPWAQLQSLARFERPHGDCDHSDRVIRLREEALRTTSRLAAARAGFRRHVDRLLAGPVGEDEHRSLLTWLLACMGAVERGRAALAIPETAAMARECELVDEYLSMQLVATLTDMARALGDIEAPRRAELDADIDDVGVHVRQALRAESQHRRARGYVSIEDASEEALARYVERAALLKKRFQALLYLRRTSRPIEERIRPWVTALSAATAGAVAFSLQLIFGTARSPATQQVGWGFVALLILVALTYGTKERLQIAGVHWLSRGLGRLYARRSTRFSTASGAVVLEARESFAEEAVASDDSDDTRAVATARLRFVHEGRWLQPAAPGPLRLIFRYDLSPLFPRLHDPLKTIGVLDQETGELQFVEAPRAYRLPVRVSISSHEVERSLSTVVVADKRGLRRMASRSGDVAVNGLAHPV